MCHTHTAVPGCVTHEPERTYTSANNSPVVKHKSEALQLQNMKKLLRISFGQAIFALIKRTFLLWLKQF